MSPRVEHIGAATLYLGDAIRDGILASLPLSNLCVSDAPYRLTSGGNAHSADKMQGIFASKNYSNDGGIVECDIDWVDMAQPIYDALKPDADCYVMANDKNVLPCGNAFLGAGFGLHNILTWDKKTATANRWYMKNIEFTLYFWKGRAKMINDPSSKQGVAGNVQRESDHQTEKPVWLMQSYILNSSQPGDIVLDPFMGSASTGIAALRSGRRFVGIEKNTKHFETACERIRRETRQADFFIDSERAAL